MHWTLIMVLVGDLLVVVGLTWLIIGDIISAYRNGLL
jgi:hypothetical protein